MADNYIDQDETLIYGPYTARKIRKVVIGLIPAFDSGLEFLANELEHATASMHSAVTSGRDADASIRQEARNKTPALDTASEVLVRFSRHLDTHRPGSIDRKVFFTTDGTASGVGRSAPRVVLALSHISTKLRLPDTPVQGAEQWLREITAAMNGLAPVVEHADDARTDRRTVTPEIEAARIAWLQTYRAAKNGVECVLRMTGKLRLMRTVFHDLVVPAGARVTAPPPESPTETAESH
jgi:hypothetical protein